MNCEQMNELLSAWLDGELSESERRQMQAHLEQCAQCRALFEQLQALHTSFSDLEEIPAPEGFAQRVMEQVEKETKPKVVHLFKRPQMRSFAALAACAVLFVGFGRVAMHGKAEEGAAPETANFAADYAGAPESAAVEYSMEEPGECAPQTPEAAEVPAMEPAAPAPDMTVQATGGERSPTETQIAADSARSGMREILLTQLPEGLEEKLGPLAWEERIGDGAQCARLTQEQAERLLQLLDDQGLTVEGDIPAEETEEGWILVWLPN